MIIVDRILNGFAVCEKDGAMLDIPLSRIDSDVREGDVLKVDESGTRYHVASKETTERSDTISMRFEALKARNKNRSSE